MADVTVRIGRRAALSTLLLAPACARVGRSSDPAALEVVVPNDAATLDPRFTTDVYGLRIARLCHVALVAPDADTAAPLPWLAQSFEDAEDGALVATLREDLRFHDGRVITADDVVATFRALGDERLGSPSRRVVTQLREVVALDARRVRFSPKTPRATLRGDLDVAILRAEEAALPRDAPLTGSGPYRVASRTPGAIALEPAGTWKPTARPLVVRTVRDEPARALRVLAGSVDVASNVLSPPLAFSLPARSDATPGLVVARFQAAATTFLALQCTRPPLDRADVRRAIARAIDRRAIVDAKLGGAATLARSLLPPSILLAPRVRTDEGELAFDPAAARAVLAPLDARLTLVTTTDRARVGIARAIAQMLSDVGLPTEVRTYEFATFFARLSAGDFDLAPLIASEVTDPDVLRWYLHSDAIPPRAANRARFRDARVDALLDRGLATLDLEARRAVYEELDALLARELPYIPLWHEDHVAITSQRAASFRPSVDGRWGALARV